MTAQQHGEFVRSDAALGIGEARCRDMGVEMVDNEFVHQSRHGAAHRRDQMQRFRTGGIALDCTFDRSDLPRDPPYPRDDRILVLRDMYRIGGYPI